MFKSRRRQAEEEAKLDPNYRPTKDLHVDESKLTEEEKGHFTKIPVAAFVVFGILIVCIVVCIVMICVFGGPIKS